MGFFKHHLSRQLLCALVFVVGVSIISCSETGTGPDPEDGNGDGEDETPTYTVSVEGAPSEAGSISPADTTVEEGEDIELLAEPADGHGFTHWSGDIDSTSDNPLSLTVDQDYAITAHFEVKSYKLTVTTEGEGTVSEEVVQQKSTDYEHGTEVELTADPAEGWQFVEWQGDITGTENPAEITVDDPKEVTAVFEKKSYSFTVNTEGEGSVAKDPDQAEYDYGSTVELTAEPAEGWQFVEWQGDIEGTDNPVQITVDKSKEVKAIFEQKSYALTVNTSGEGTVSEEIAQQKATDYEHGTVVELTADPAEGWQFVEWQGDITGSENPAEITVDDPKEVTAVFERKSFGLTVSTTGSGTVAKTPDQSEYDYGTEVTLEATANDGYTFTGWTGDQQSSDNPLTVTITRDTEITANFSKKEYSLTVSANPSEGGSVSPSSGTFEHGTEVTVEATANEGYTFEEWTGDQQSTENPLTFTVTADTELTANFSKKEYSLTVSANPSGGGTISPSSGTFEHGTEVTVEATANEGYTFTEWTGDRQSTENPLTFTITADTEISANFAEAFVLDASANPSDGGTVEINPDLEKYESGTEVRVEAIPSEGWEFTGWTGDKESTANLLKFEINKDTKLTANFSKKEYYLSVRTSGFGTVTKMPDQSEYKYATEITLEAIPDNGWEFTGWTGDIKSTDNPLTFTIDENTNRLTANFEEKESIYTIQMMATDSEDTLDVKFGQQAGATRGFDDGLDQHAPPTPPSGVFHVYFDINSTSLFKDFRSMMAKDEQWNFHYQLGTGDQLKLEWQLTDDTKTPGNLILTDGSNSFEVNMFNKNSHTISGNESGKLIIQYSLE